MLIQILLLLVGLTLILVGANYLVEGSSNIAKKFGVSEFVIGLTIVGIGTSTPEMVVSFLSAIQGKSTMAIGNIIGSNIFNTALILGITAIISPLVISRDTVRRDMPLNIIATVLLIVLGLNQTLFGIGSDSLNRIDGLIFVMIFVYYIWISFKRDNHNQEEETEAEPTAIRPIWLSIIMILGGLAGLVFGGRFFVDSATEIAHIAGVSDKFIAITVMAGGTSLPELATSAVAAIKGRGQLALGNILGSNISNILLILGGSALIRPLPFGDISPIDLGTVLLCAVMLPLTAFFIGKNKITRIEGLFLVLIQVFYMSWLIINL